MPDDERVVTAVAALELFQACAIIHDDVMDHSETRRGQPTAHRRFGRLHGAAGWRGDGDSFGTGAAILLGDLCLAWTDEMFFGSGLEAARLDRARPLFDEMRTELMGGQYLDLLEQAIGGGSVVRARRVIQYKSARYSVMRPLQLGAALAGAERPLLAGYEAYGLPLGEAFQLRDDVLGVFGDPVETQAGRRRPARGQADRARRAGRPVEQRGPGPAAGAAPRRPGTGHVRGGDGAGDHRGDRGAGRGGADDPYLHRAGGGRARGLAGRPVRRGRAARVGRRRHRPQVLSRRRTSVRTVVGPTDRVVVVGAGLGGLSAALRLAGAGREVTVLERAAVPGGRAGRLELGGYAFDTGPTVLTMPQLIADALGSVGERLEDWLELLPVDPVYRAYFPDGSTLDVHAEVEAMAAEVERVALGECK